jgi:hypothetical protein
MEGISLIKVQKRTYRVSTLSLQTSAAPISNKGKPYKLLFVSWLQNELTRQHSKTQFERK